MLELNRTYNLDCREGLQLLDDESIDCCVTSPPYFGLRDYGCNGQIGLENTLEEYIETILEVFRHIKRVLKDEGTLWLNLGDSYAGSGKGATKYSDNALKYKQGTNKGMLGAELLGTPKIPCGLKAKDKMLIPWRVGLALQLDGWYVRQDIIWHKPNAMPESVTDRPTTVHEYILLLSKSQHYYYDYEAIKEDCVNGDPNPPRGSIAVLGNRHKGNRKTFRGGGAYVNHQAYNNSENVEPTSKGNKPNLLLKRNKRSVWTVATAQKSVVHYATFPPELIKPCILAGCPEGGTVCDPFMGSGTTGKVANDLGRNFIGFDTNKEYCEMANEYTAQLKIDTSAVRA